MYRFSEVQVNTVRQILHTTSGLNVNWVFGQGGNFKVVRCWSAPGSRGRRRASRAEALLGPAVSPSSAGTALCLPQSASSRLRSWAVEHTQRDRQVRAAAELGAGAATGGQQGESALALLAWGYPGSSTGLRPHPSARPICQAVCVRPACLRDTSRG